MKQIIKDALTEHRNYQPGDIVTVFNRTYNGKFIIEGRAAIKKIVGGQDMYMVHFFRQDGPFMLRYVDPNGQTDAQAYVKILNDWRVADTSSDAEAKGNQP